MFERHWYLADPTATEALGIALADVLRAGAGGVIALHGTLGAGKTTLVRSCLRALGVQGAIKSPTYTLVEPYDIAKQRVLHLDLYRLADPEELYGLGIFDEAPDRCWWLVEWPEKAGPLLPAPVLTLQLKGVAEGRGREARAQATEARFLPVMRAGCQ